LHVVDEGDVVGGVPVEAVADGIERDRLQQLVDGGHDLGDNITNWFFKNKVLKMFVFAVDSNVDLCNFFFIEI
jgi:hypothetical protein